MNSHQSPPYSDSLEQSPPRGNIKSNSIGRRKRFLKPIWLFFIFALYGPSINIIGEFRYVEILLLVILCVNANIALKRLGKWERILSILFFLTAFMQIVSDLINDASFEGTLKRSFTYILLALLIIAVRHLTRGDIMRLRWVLAGYYLSFLTVLVLGQTASRNYEIMAWQLGLGTAATVAICLIPLWIPRAYRLVGPALLAMSAIHLLSSGRALAVLTALAGVVAIWGSLAGRSAPPKFRPAPFLFAVSILFLTSFLAIQGAKWITDAQVLPQELQQKMEIQLSNPYGIIAAGRPDTAAAIYGITRSPWIGYGSTNADPAVMAFYYDIVASSYINQGSYLEMMRLQMNKDWSLGTPSHSHLFGAWVDAGIIAAISWAVILGLAVIVFSRSAVWRHPFSPLFIYISVLVMWDTVFSPGPIRMDVALRLAILIYAMETFRRFDLARRQRPPSRLGTKSEPSALGVR